MIAETRYYSNLPRKPNDRPSDGLPAIGVIADWAQPHSIIGIAYPYTHIGGCQLGDAWNGDYAPPEVVFRLVLDRAWLDDRIVALEAKETLDGRFVLRNGEFIELSEDA